MTRYEVTAVVNVHGEGLMIVPTLRSVTRTAEFARSRGISVRILVAADRPSQLTRDVLSEHPDFDVRVFDFGDPGLSRQAAGQMADSKYICFVDGDDLWATNWIADAWSKATTFDRPAVWHPACSLYFGTVAFIYPHVDMEGADFDKRYLSIDNYWTSAVFTPTESVLNIPFLESSKKNRLGHEDWNWHCRTIEAGYLHKVVPDTVHFIRRRPGSTSAEAIQQQSMCLPHTLFARSMGSSDLF